ncbi:hypothetical protein LINPERPRIM_LOCUS30676 [Linum perenne]
MGNYCFSHF